MPTTSGHRPVVYGASSVRPLDPALLAAVELRPPVRRGDLTALKQREPGVVVLIDGLFGATMAVTPTECRDLLDAGWTVVGCSSMGALRAADLWPLGMIGIGDIYTLFRLGTLTSDADVAVALSPEDDHGELTVSTVHLRAVLQAALSDGTVTAALRERMARRAEDIYWLERSWAACRAAWRTDGIPSAAIESVLRLGRDARLHPKVRDAETTLRSVLAQTWPGTSYAPAGTGALREAEHTAEAVADSVQPVQRVQPVRRCAACQARLAGDALFCPTCVSEAHETCL
ncbi:TfuA-like protein [Streptomyces sp. SAS_270]|uniref:TfuA-like protein n=1 Tax=Streptomyces sp. SAS_270 TaxID=3412748 RepID=UPI00403C44C3